MISPSPTGSTQFRGILSRLCPEPIMRLISPNMRTVIGRNSRTASIAVYA